MEYYVDQYIKRHSEEIKTEARKTNWFTDPEYFEGQIDSLLASIKDELAAKFNDVCLLVMRLALSGREDELRRFEVLFLDLLERTLLKEVSTNPQIISKMIEEFQRALREERGEEDIG